jgi:hypothetical protein
MIMRTQFSVSTTLAHFEAVGVLRHWVECGCYVMWSPADELQFGVTL